MDPITVFKTTIHHFCQSKVRLKIDDFVLSLTTASFFTFEVFSDSPKTKMNKSLLAKAAGTRQVWSDKNVFFFASACHIFSSFYLRPPIISLLGTQG